MKLVVAGENKEYEEGINITKLIEVENVETPDYVTVSVEGPVRLRLSPGGKDSGLRVDFDETFKYLGEQGNWYKISYKGRALWISKDCSWAE